MFPVSENETDRVFRIRDTLGLLEGPIPPEQLWLDNCSHDLYGPLPAIEIEDDGDRLKVVSTIRNEAAKLSAIHGLRKELVEMFEDATFLDPTLVDV